LRVDFGRVIPMPPEDDPMFTANRTEHRDENDQVFMVSYSMGGYSPLDWRREHWGTKWNASSAERPAEDRVRFETAWSCPEPVLVALSKMHSGERIAVRFADEDT